MLFKQSLVLVILALATLSLVSATSNKRSTCKPKPMSACDPEVKNYIAPGLVRPRYVCGRDCACLAEERDAKAFTSANCCNLIQCPLKPGYDMSTLNNFKASVCKKSPMATPANSSPVEEIQVEEGENPETEDE